jgi:tetratricopeptide (TPR) repeat protein
MKRLLLVLCIATTLPTFAQATGVEAGTAGAAALNRQDYNEAIRQFTLALKAGDLAPDDQELAYLNRGKAHLAKGEYQLASADLRQAIKLRPDDAEAKDALQVALAGPPKPEPKVQPAHGRHPSQHAKNPWGVLAILPGDYWMEMDAKPEYYLHYQWETPGKSLAFSGLDHSGNPIAGRYQLDPATPGITGLTAYRKSATATTVEISGNDFAETGDQDGTTIRHVYQQTSALAFQVTTQTYMGGAWKTTKTANFVQVTPAIVQALGWKARTGDSAALKLFKEFGASVKQGVFDRVNTEIQNAGHPKAPPAPDPQAAPNQ